MEHGSRGSQLKRTQNKSQLYLHPFFICGLSLQTLMVKICTSLSLHHCRISYLVFFFIGYNESSFVLASAIEVEGVVEMEGLRVSEFDQTVMILGGHDGLVSPSYRWRVGLKRVIGV